MDGGDTLNTREKVQRAIKAALLEGSKDGSRHARAIEVGTRTTEYVSAIKLAFRRVGGLIDPEYRDDIIAAMRDKGGYPPERAIEDVERLLDGLREAVKGVFIPGLEPAKLEIPKGKPKFLDAVMPATLDFDNRVHWEMVKMFAAASDSEGQTPISAYEGAQQLGKIMGAQVNSGVIASNVARGTIDEVLRRHGLKVDIVQIKKRSPETKSFTITNGYRLAWITD